jgi:flagellum-specific peptidoglycan hydrolase FlgJ
MDSKEFVSWLASAAQRVCAAYKLPASVCIAQGALESGWGEYIIGEYNLFGRKWNGTGSYLVKQTEEYYDGQWQTVSAKFQAYESLEEAIQDWCVLLTEEPVYESCLTYRQDAEAFAKALGHIYATDPDYADKILSIIAANELKQYD